VPSVCELSNVNGPFVIEVIAFVEKFITKVGHVLHTTLTPLSKTAASKVVKLLCAKLTLTPFVPLILLIALFGIEVILLWLRSNFAVPDDDTYACNRKLSILVKKLWLKSTVASVDA